MSLTGGKIGLLVRGTILKYNNDGTVDVGVDRDSGTQTPQRFTVPMPLSFSGPEGEFIGGCPPRGASVVLSHAQGEWFISSYIHSNKIFQTNTFGSGGLGSNLMSELRPGRIILQTKKAQSRLLLDPNDGIRAGIASQELHVDPKRSILSHNFKHEMSFTSAHRSISGTIKRDLKENSVRDITGSILSAHEYDDNLFTIGMDPSTNISTTTTSTLVRNLPLTEQREILYEFQNLPTGVGFTTDDDEAARYISKQPPDKPQEILRYDSRANTFNLGLHNPNHLLETIKGTGVDIYGNILDINRSVLPIGKTNELSLIKNPDSQDAFKRIRALHRKSLAFHFELNSRKQTGNDDISQAPDVNNKNDYSKNRSRFFLDIDKEGQFKLNVSASSETGNIPLLTRYENASTILSSQGEITNPNAFVRESNNQDIFHEDFANISAIKLSKDEDDIEGHEAPIDRFTDKPIKLGTAYHDITKTALQHQDTGREKLINYFLEDQTYLNRIDYVEKVVSDTIIMSGPNANAGGRSGLLNFDGFLSVNIGANTVDRQSLWLDLAGGVVANYGRDKYGRSYAATYDGDVVIQIGSTGVTGDSRFANENNAHRAGTFDIRVVDGTGQLAVIRVDRNGLFITTPGRAEFNSEQEMIFRSNSNIQFDAEHVIFYPGGNPRVVKRNAVPEI